MIHDPGATERAYHANLAKAPVTLFPKRCSCGRAAPSKQPIQSQTTFSVLFPYQTKKACE
jgi:hypothetical protein